MAEIVLVDRDGNECTVGTAAEAVNLRARGYRPKKQQPARAPAPRPEPKIIEGEK